jgi:hypothetical protein
MSDDLFNDARRNMRRPMVDVIGKLRHVQRIRSRAAKVNYKGRISAFIEFPRLTIRKSSKTC